MRLYCSLFVLFGLACDDGGSNNDPTPDLGRDVEVDLDQGAGDSSVDAAQPDAAVDSLVADAAPDMADARIPVRAEERPTEGEADLPGADDLTLGVAAGQARAGIVSEDAERLTGPEAECRVGHFRMDNARISLCLQGEDSYSQLTFSGGNIIDAHRADRPGTDLLGETYIAPGLGEVTVEEMGIVRDGSDGGPAIIRTAGHVDGSRLILGYLTVQPAPAYVITEYRLEPDADWVDVYSWIGAEDRFLSFLAVEFMVFGDRTRGFIPGATLVGETPDVAKFLAASGDDVSYGWNNTERDLTFLRLPLDEFPLAPVSYGQLGLGAGDDMLFKRRLTIGTGDIESVRPAPEGAVEMTFSGPAGAAVTLDDTTAAVTRFKLGADGTRVVMLAPGDYRATAPTWVGGAPEPVLFSVAGAAEIALELASPGTIRMRVRDAEGNIIGARTEMTQGDEGRRLNYIDESTATLPAGAWRVVTTRGWHFTADDQEVDVVAGEETLVDVVLTEVIPFEGWTSGDFHQHASPSLDSTVAVEDRVMSNVSEGVGFMAPTDHDRIFEYAPLIESMGVRAHISSPIIGLEISPLRAHLGAFGLNYVPGRDAGGAPSLAVRPEARWRKATMPELIRTARERGAEVVQVNHPRASQGYFDLVGYNPNVDITTLTEDDEWTTSLDTVEVYNGSSDFCRVMGDWMGLLNQGMQITGVGNSDTHSLGDPAGYPRNYLPTSAGDPTDVTKAEIVAALRDGRVSVGGGAYIDLPAGPMLGDTVEVGEDFGVRVRVRTPPFARVHRVLAFVNGVTVADVVIESEAEDIVDFDEVIEIATDIDGPLVFLALGDPRSQYVSNEPIFAFTNPIWLDRDGDGDVAAIGPGAIEFPVMQICQ